MNLAKRSPLANYEHLFKIINMVRKTHKLFFALTVIGFPLFAFSESEPNNDYTQANTLGVNSSDAGTLTESTDNNDWWKITIPADGKLVVNTTSAATMDIDLTLYDINGTSVIASYDTSNGIHEATHYNSLMPGTYYVNAHRWTGSGSYTISSIYTATAFANDTENNDTYSTAITLPLNGNSTGHLNFYSNGYTDIDDWWKIIIPADGKLIVNTTSDATIDIDLSLYDINGTSNIASYDTSNGIHEATHYNNLMPGTYYVKAHRWTGYGSYTISSVYTATAFANDAEINDTYTTAATIPLNGSTTGHLYFYSNGYTDVDDWWKVGVLSGGNLVVRTTSDATLDIDLFLYDTDGSTQIAGYDTSSGIHEATHFDNITAGIYYVKAHRWTGYGSYTISSDFSVGTEITNSQKMPNEISVFPNPAFGKVTVSSSEKIDVIEIYNILGEKIYSLNDPKQKTSYEIDFSNFPKGTYFIKIIDGINTQTKKIVLQ
ncbi:MAG: T9SS type A sorting domain-containing protein [Bacteroidetes bacterium]|nr:T9SS type A sorting domain-containing protein [Bacteroidota bacterium]